MKVPAHQTIDEFIRDDVHEIVAKTWRAPMLAYLVNWGDAMRLIQRLKPDISDAEFHARDFELHTEGGLVRVIGDRNSPRDVVYRMVVCKCGALALYTPGIDECLNCLTLKPRPYAPGEKMTDRHPDSVIAKVVEETIEKQVKHLTTPIVTTCPGYNGVFHIDPDPPDLADRQAARVAEHQCREAEQLASGPFDYDVPHYDGILKAPYEQPAAGRPDGFDQGQIDAAKAALLAPVPPRYPRATTKR